MNSNILFSLRNKQSRLFLNKESALKLDSERALFLFRVSGIPFLVSEKRDIIFARPYGGIQGVQGAAGHMGPALHGIFVGQGTRALPWVREKNPPVTALPCQPPLGKGAWGRENGLPQPVCALASQ